MAKREDYDTGAAETVVGATVKIEGDLVSEGDIKVDGMVAGKIKTSKNLYVGPMAKIEADVEANSAILAGAVKGEIKIKESLLIQETAKVSGNVTCTRLAIMEGANFSGNCNMPEAEEGLAQGPAEEE